MRGTALLLLAIPVSFAALAPRDRPDFSGTWTMDVARSESAHQTVPVLSSTLVIRMTGARVSIETTRIDEGNAEFHEALNFRLDGSETTNTGYGGVPVIGTARWDGAKMIIETTRSINGSTITTRYVYALDANGRNLTVDKTLAVQHGYQGRFAANTGRGKDIFRRVGVPAVPASGGNGAK